MNCLRYPLPPATPIAQCYLVVDHFLLFIVLVGLLSPWALALVAISLEDEMLLVWLMQQFEPPILTGLSDRLLL